MMDSFLPSSWRDIPQNIKSYSHSRTVARAAYKIAEHTFGALDSQKARVYGLMHDIGKFYLSTKDLYKHPRVGYDLMKSQYPDIARICITHPFTDFGNYSHILSYCKNDEMEAKRISNVLKGIEKDDYMDLIQLCDKISRLDDYISLEGKVQWYLERYHLDPQKLQGEYLTQLNNLKLKFDEMSKVDIYDLLGAKK